MKLIINNSQLDAAPEMFITRTAGYAFITDRGGGHDSFARSLGRNFYPRFHIYIERRGENIIFNLHLDQKKPIYPGAHAHNAEYDGEAVEGEINRLKILLK